MHNISPTPTYTVKIYLAGDIGTKQLEFYEIKYPVNNIENYKISANDKD